MASLYPLKVLKNKVKASRHRVYRLNRGLRRKVIFQWPIYDICSWLSNRTAERGYAVEKAHMELDAIQQRVVNELTEKGISAVRFNDLFPDRTLGELQELAENHLQRPGNQQRIKAIETAALSTDVSKFYLVRLLGRPPVFDHTDKFVELALSDSILRIVSAYLGMFSRIADMDLWCNIPTEGPDRYSQSWHRDPDDRKLVKVFLYLRDVDRDAGPFCYIPGSHNDGPFSNIHRQTMPESRYPGKGEVEEHFAEQQIMTCTGNAGTLIFCNTTGLHKGGHPKRGFRVLFTAAYTSNAGLFDPDNKDRYVIAGLRKEGLLPAAKYGIGRVRSK